MQHFLQWAQVRTSISESMPQRNSASAQQSYHRAIQVFRAADHTSPARPCRRPSTVPRSRNRPSRSYLSSLKASMARCSAPRHLDLPSASPPHQQRGGSHRPAAIRDECNAGRMRHLSRATGVPELNTGLMQKPHSVKASERELTARRIEGEITIECDPAASLDEGRCLSPATKSHVFQPEQRQETEAKADKEKAESKEAERGRARTSGPTGITILGSTLNTGCRNQSESGLVLVFSRSGNVREVRGGTTTTSH